MSRLAITAVVTLVLGGCTWVELTDAGRDVRVVETKAEAASEDCERIGRISATTRERVMGMKRPDDTLREELAALARNEAARIGGNTIVALEAPSEGRQPFAVWRCPSEA